MKLEFETLTLSICQAGGNIEHLEWQACLLSPTRKSQEAMGEWENVLKKPCMGSRFGRAFIWWPSSGILAIKRISVCTESDKGVARQNI